MSNDTRIVISANGDQAIDALATLGKQIEELNKKAKDNAKGWLEWGRDVSTALNQTLSVFGKVPAAINMVWDLAKDGAKMAQTRAMFREVAAEYGMVSDAIVEAAQKATKGTVADFDLMTKSMQALKRGVGANTEEMGQLWEISRLKAKQFGMTTVEAFEQITTAIGRGMGRSLLDLGLLPEKFGRSADAAKLLENRASVLKTVLEQGGDEIKRYSNLAGSEATGAMARMEASVKNLKYSLSEDLLPAIGPVVTLMANLTTEAIKASRAMMWQFAYAQDPDLVKNPFAGQPASTLRPILQDAESRALKAGRALNRAQAVAGPLLGAGFTATDPNIVNGETQVKQHLAAIEAEVQARETMVQQLREAISLDEKMVSLGQKRAEMESKIALASEKATASKASSKSKAEKEVKETENYFGFIAEAADVAKFHWEKVVGAVESYGLAVQRAKETTADIEARLLGRSRRVDINDATPTDAVSGLIDRFSFGAVSGKGFSRSAPEQTERALREQIETPLSRVFNDALVKGLEGGDFFGALANGLKRVVIEAFANQISGALFGTSGAVSGVIGGATGAGGGGGGSLLGGIFKPIRHSAAAGGGLNFANIGMNLGIGFALSRLTGEGGLFGGRVVHGQEAIGQAAGINQQVAAGRTQLQDMVGGGVGMSSATREALSALTLWTAGYTTSKSGDGIFSKKTTTYALDSAAAEASLAKLAELTARAQAEIAAREFEKAMAGLTDQVGALIMSLEDLKKAVDSGKASDATIRQYQLLQAQARESWILGNQSRSTDALSALLSMPYAQGGVGFGGGLGSSIMEWVGGSGDALKRLMGVATGTTGMGSPDAQVGFQDATGTWRNMSGANLSSTADMLATMALAKGAMADQFEVSRGLASSDPAVSGQARERQKMAIGNQIGYLDSIMAEAEKQVNNLALSLEARQSAFDRWKRAQEAYYAAKSEMLTLEENSANQLASKQQRIEDIMGTLLTRIGETSTIGGQQVVVLSAGQPKGITLARQLLDAIGGAEPELSSALQQFMAAVGGDRWG